MKDKFTDYIKVFKAFKLVYKARYFLSGLVIVEMVAKLTLKLRKKTDRKDEEAKPIKKKHTKNED